MTNRAPELIAWVASLAWLACVACGGKTTPPPAGPKPLDVKQLAAEIYAEMVELAEVTQRTRADCPTMAPAMRPIVARMRASADRVAVAKQDPAVAKQLTTELRTYDARTAGLSDTIAAGLIACHDDRDVMLIVDAIPTM